MIVIEVVTALVLIEMLLDSLPGVIAVLLGTMTSPGAPDSNWTTYPLGALPFRVRPRFVDNPPFTDEGVIAHDWRMGALTATNVVFDTPAVVAVKTAPVFARTGSVVTVNPAELEPAGTVTEFGTAAAALSEARAITRPAGPAGPVSIAVPAIFTPPSTELGVAAKD